MFKKAVIAGFLCFFLVISAEAAVVSFMIIESVTPVESENELKQHSILWENTLFDIFFDNGYITGNFPMQHIDYKADNINEYVNMNYDELTEGGVDIFIIIQLDYKEREQTASNISINIFRLDTKKNIYSRQLAGKSYKNVKDETDDIKKIIRGFLPYLK